MPVQCPSKIKQYKSLDVTISIPKSILMIKDSNVPLAVLLSSAVHVVLTTRPACRPSLVSCLSSLEESLLSVTIAHGQSLRVLPSLSATSESGSHVTVAVSGLVYSATVVVPGVSEVGTPVHIPARGASEAHDVLSGLTLLIEPKPLGQHRPPPPRSILSPGELFYPPISTLTRYAISGTASAGSIQTRGIPSLRSTGGSRYEDGGSGGNGNAAGAMHLVRHSPAEGGNSEVSGDGDGVGMARSLSTSAFGGRDM
nr:hypothetical protein [Tanacetum cinerariifolium]